MLSSIVDMGDTAPLTNPLDYMDALPDYVLQWFYRVANQYVRSMLLGYLPASAVPKIIEELGFEFDPVKIVDFVSTHSFYNHGPDSEPEILAEDLLVLWADTYCNVTVLLHDSDSDIRSDDDSNASKTEPPESSRFLRVDVPQYIQELARGASVTSPVADGAAGTGAASEPGLVHPLPIHMEDTGESVAESAPEIIPESMDVAPPESISMDGEDVQQVPPESSWDGEIQIIP